MPEARPPGVGADAAWVGVDTPLALPDLQALAANPERILRVNPLWRFETWERPAPDRFYLQIHNQANGLIWTTSGRLERRADGLVLHFDTGIKASTRFWLEPLPTGSRLWILDDYGRLPEPERQVRLAEVDTSLVPWGQALGRYLRAWARWSRLPPWRWYMDSIWLFMTPQARRVVRWLLWISLADIGILLGLIWLIRLAP